MRHFILFLILLFGAAFSSLRAESTMTFIAGNDVCTPITVTVGGNSYTVYGSLTIAQTDGTVTATDCSGYKLKYDYASRGNVGNSSNTYTFHNAYDVNRDSNSDSYDNSNNSDDYDSASRAADGIRSLIFGGNGGYGDAYPALSIMPGASYAYGENIRLRYAGHSFLAYASIGKDWLFDSDYKDKILWNVGIGSYYGFGGNGNPNMDVSFGLSIGQHSRWEKLSLMIDADYICWFGRWRRVGFFAGGGLGWGSFTEVFNTDNYDSTGGFAWNLELGFIIRIASF